MRRVSPRYELERPLQYRPEGEASWREATVINISSTGVVFSAPELLCVGTKLELSIELGTSDDVLPAATLIGQATVVRAEHDAGANWHALAAELTDYQLDRPGASERCATSLSHLAPPGPVV